MKPVECPRCHAQAVFAWIFLDYKEPYEYKKPYCPQCGWNQHAVEQKLRGKLEEYGKPVEYRYFLLGIITIGLFLWWVGVRWGALLVLGGALLLFLMVPYFMARSALRKLLAQPPPAPAPSPARETPELPPLQVSGPTVSYKGVEIPVAPPRRIRLSRDGKIFYVLAILGLTVSPAFVVYWIVNKFTSWVDPLFLSFMAALLLLIGYNFLRGLRRQGTLLRTGQLALATVTQQERTIEGGHTYAAAFHYITYYFRDHTGREVTKTSKDHTESFYEGMTVPVIYDRSDPQNNVALCSTDFEVLP